MYAPQVDRASQSFLRTLFSPKNAQNTQKVGFCPRSALKHRFASICDFCIVFPTSAIWSATRGAVYLWERCKRLEARLRKHFDRASVRTWARSCLTELPTHNHFSQKRLKPPRQRGVPLPNHHQNSPPFENFFGVFWSFTDFSEGLSLIVWSQ